MRTLLRLMIICLLLVGWVVPLTAQVNCSSRIDHPAVGREALIAGDYATAIANYDCTINGIGRSVDAYLGRMLALMLSGEFTAANADIIAAFEMGGLDVFINMVSQFDDIIDDEPTASAYAARGMLEWLIGEDGNAVTLDLTDAIDMGEDTPAILLVRGLTSYTYGIGATQDAFNDIERALEDAPNDGEFHRLAANAYYLVGEAHEAIELFEKALEIDPDLSDAYSDLGDLYIDLNEYDLAIENFDRYLGATSTEDEDPTVYFNIGFSYDKMGDQETASGYFYQFLTIAGFNFNDEDSLEVNEPVTVAMSQGQVYEFTVQLTEGQVVDFSAESSIPALVDPLLVVLDPDGEGVIANDDRTEENFNSLIRQFVAPETGTYTVLVSHAFGGSEGDVDVELIVAGMDV